LGSLDLALHCGLFDPGIGWAVSSLFCIILPLVSEQKTKAEIFDVFLCHNSEDKPAAWEIAQKLSQENINVG
jgi:hypothetical protein